MSESGLFRLRMAPDLKARVAKAGRENNRSMNAEILHRLEASFDAKPLGWMSYSNLDGQSALRVDLPPETRAPAVAEAIRKAMFTLAEVADVITREAGGEPNPVAQMQKPDIVVGNPPYPGNTKDQPSRRKIVIRKPKSKD